MKESSVLIAGLGNIGSPLAGLIARLGFRRLILVDRDRVEVKNVRSQDYRPADVGRYKAEVIADRLRGQIPDLDVISHTTDLEDLPLGEANVSLVLGALDSRRARQILVSEMAWPLSVPAIDGGVGEGWRGRVQVFVPGEGSACLECGWGREDYRLLSQEYPCIPGASVEAPPTAAPAFVGAAVASVMAAEAARFLSGQEQGENHEIAFDLLHRRHLVTRLRHNPRCRFGHEIVRETVALGRPFESATAADLLQTIANRTGAGTLCHLEVRRGLGPRTGFAASRLLSRDWLAEAGIFPLASIGFEPADLVRVRLNGGSLFVRLQ